MISDKPKKAKTNSNTNKKKADTTRDVVGNESNSNSASDTKGGTNSKSDDGDKKDAGDKKDTSGETPPKPQNTPAAKPKDPDPRR